MKWHNVVPSRLHLCMPRKVACSQSELGNHGYYKSWDHSKQRQRHTDHKTRHKPASDPDTPRQTAPQGFPCNAGEKKNYKKECSTRPKQQIKACIKYMLAAHALFTATRQLLPQLAPRYLPSLLDIPLDAGLPRLQDGVPQSGHFLAGARSACAA